MYEFTFQRKEDVVSPETIFRRTARFSAQITPPLNSNLSLSQRGEIKYLWRLKTERNYQ